MKEHSWLKVWIKLRDYPTIPLILSHADNVIKRYQRRLKQLENLCLADFVAWFNCKSERNEKKQLNLMLTQHF
jgi:hypothetical protein